MPVLKLFTVLHVYWHYQDDDLKRRCNKFLRIYFLLVFIVLSVSMFLVLAHAPFWRVAFSKENWWLKFGPPVQLLIGSWWYTLLIAAGVGRMLYLVCMRKREESLRLSRLMMIIQEFSIYLHFKYMENSCIIIIISTSTSLLSTLYLVQVPVQAKMRWSNSSLHYRDCSRVPCNCNKDHCVCR